MRAFTPIAGLLLVVTTSAPAAILTTTACSLQLPPQMLRDSAATSCVLSDSDFGSVEASAAAMYGIDGDVFTFTADLLTTGMFGPRTTTDLPFPEPPDYLYETDATASAAFDLTLRTAGPPRTGLITVEIMDMAGTLDGFVESTVQIGSLFAQLSVNSIEPFSACRGDCAGTFSFPLGEDFRVRVRDDVGFRFGAGGETGRRRVPT